MIIIGAMNKREKPLEELEKELDELQKHHRSAWEDYGSELCAGDMIAQEERLEKQIAKLKAEKEKEYINDVSQILDD
jgi:hypothetical protein